MLVKATAGWDWFGGTLWGFEEFEVVDERRLGGRSGES
jgi:hypothetical protein